MGCNASSARQATEPEAPRPTPTGGVGVGVGSTSMPLRSASLASRSLGLATRSMSVASRKSRSVLSSVRRSSHSLVTTSQSMLSRKLSRRLSRKNSSASSVNGAPEVHLPVLLPTVGAPLSDMECVFNQKRFKCKQCGNSGINMHGRFCNCPYGGKRPPAELDERYILQDYSTLTREEDGSIKKPIFKIGIRGHYVFSKTGLHPSLPKEAEEDAAPAPLLHSYASEGPTLQAALRTLQMEAQCSQLQGLINALPDILEEVTELVGVETLENLDDKVEAVDVVVYRCLNATVEDKIFLNWLDTAGYNMMTLNKDLDFSTDGVAVHAGLRHDRKAMRISVSRDGVCVDALVRAAKFM